MGIWYRCNAITELQLDTRSPGLSTKVAPLIASIVETNEKINALHIACVSRTDVRPKAVFKKNTRVTHILFTHGCSVRDSLLIKERAFREKNVRVARAVKSTHVHKPPLLF